MEYKQLAESLVNKALSKGADQVEIYIQASRNMSVRLRNGEIETVQESAANGAGFRVFSGGRMAFSSSNDFSDVSLENAVNSAVRMAKITTKDENNVIPSEKGITAVQGLYDSAIKEVPIDKKIAMLKEVERLAMRDKRINLSAGAGYSESEGEIVIANSNGLSKSYKSSSCGYGVSVVAEKGDQKCSGSEYSYRRSFNHLKNPNEIADEAARKAYSMLDPKMVKTQKAAVIFDPDAARSVLGGLLAAVNGERVLQGASFIADKMDQQIASPLLTIIDDGTMTGGMNSKPFDGEGVPTQKRVIVDQGILKGFMYNTIVAKRAGTKSTGNASRGGFTALPGIGSHNFYINAGTDNPDDIIKDTNRGLYLTGVTGYGIDPVSGNFSGGASGYWVENGRIVYPVKGLTIAGSGLEMLKNIDKLGTDLDLDRGFTAPTFRISVLQIGGL